MNLDNLSPEDVEKLKSLLKEDGDPTVENIKPEAPAASHKKKKRHINRFIFVGGGVILAVLLAFGYTFLVEPMLITNSAQMKLDQEANVAPVLAINTDMLSYKPAKKDVLNGANPKQLALGIKKNVTTPPYFEFKSKNANQGTHVVDLYLDFFSQQGRDFISMNQVTLTNLIGNGRITLRVHPAVQKNGFSIFAPEALAEVFGTNPDKAWNFFLKLMKESDSILSTNAPTDKQASDQEILTFIGKIASEVKIPAGACSANPCDTVDSDSIKFLSFFSWLYSGADNPKLNVGYYPPIIYIDGKLVNNETYKFSDPSQVVSMFDTLAPRK